MSSSTELNGKLNTTPDLWSRVLAAGTSRIAAAIALALVVIAGSVFAYRNKLEIWDFVKGGHDGQIIVNSPTIYTRQRLVNDRLNQTTWLAEQLRAADGITRGKDNVPVFNNIDQIRYQTAESRAALRLDPPPSPSASTENGQPKEPQNNTNQQRPLPSDDESPRGLGSVSSTTAAIFRAKNAFRDEVRSEMMQTRLDDRHDILGNTVYRLSFDATVLAGTRRNSVAAIEVKLGHYPHREEYRLNNKELEELSDDWAGRIRSTKILYANDYKQLAADWVRYMQKLVGQWIDNIANSLTEGGLDDRVRLTGTRFITGRICEIIDGDIRLGDNIRADCDASQATEGSDASPRASRLAAIRLMRQYTEEYFREMEHASWTTFVSLFPSKDEEGQRQAYEFARHTCRTNNLKILASSPAFFRLLYGSQAGASLVSELKSSSSTGTSGAKATVPDQARPLAGKQTEPSQQASPQIPCPFFDTPAHRLLSGILLYGELIRLRAGEFPQSANTKDDLDILRNENCKKRPALGDPVLCGYPNRGMVARCFAADFIKVNLNQFDPSRGTRHGTRPISDYLRLEIVGREMGQCHLLVSLNSDRKSVDQLKYYLNSNTEAFSYSITPKSLSDNVMTSMEVRDAFELMAKQRLGSAEQGRDAVAEALRKRSREVQTILSHPIVVGFGSGIQPIKRLKSPHEDEWSSVVRTTVFGWAISPRLREGEEPVHIDGQHTLTAVISVPSWWRSVELDISTCWIAREELPELVKARDGAIDLCRGRSTHPDWTVIRLPGAIPELSRKLGYEVVEEPYFSFDQEPQELEIGKKGSLLLRGVRLWRSTEVTLGTQTADLITVLPNMEGIVATFNCVLPQSGTAVSDKAGEVDIIKIVRVPTRVWTSEGVTPPTFVTLKWPKAVANLQAHPIHYLGFAKNQEKPDYSARLCSDEQTKSSSSTRWPR